MARHCSHLDAVKTAHAHSRGCEECLKLGDTWVHLRLCRSCGHVGCCDDSKNRHATRHAGRRHAEYYTPHSIGVWHGAGTTPARGRLFL